MVDLLIKIAIESKDIDALRVLADLPSLDLERQTIVLDALFKLTKGN